MTSRPAKTQSPKAASESDRERLEVIVAAIDDRKGVDLKVLELGEVSDFTDYFVICSGSNQRQVGAIIDAIVRRMREIGHRPLHVEGENQAQWILIDYGDIIVHVFDEERRAFYRLERIWSDAPNVTARWRAE